MWVSAVPEKASIWRIMVDQRYQNAGIGRTALNLSRHHIKACDQVKEIEIFYVPKSSVAKDFYSNFCVQEVDLDEDGEDMSADIEL
jgi:diamine N-acetyltransferase